MFILLARDVLAPDLIRWWAKRRLEAIEAGDLPVSDIGHALHALDVANELEAWRASADGKWKNPPAAPLSDYPDVP